MDDSYHLIFLIIIITMGALIFGACAHFDDDDDDDDGEDCRLQVCTRERMECSYTSFRTFCDHPNYDKIVGSTDDFCICKNAVTCDELNICVEDAMGRFYSYGRTWE